MSVQFYRESPGKFDSRTLSRKTLSRWTGRNGADAKVMNFDRFGEKGTPWHFWEGKSRLTGVPQEVPLSNKTINIAVTPLVLTQILYHRKCDHSIRCYSV